METVTLAQIKIRPPRHRAGLIERRELEQAFGKAVLNHRLVLLLAPAGYGKTAALSRQLSRLSPDCASAWIALDEEDDLTRFVGCLIAALEPYDPPWRMAPEAIADQFQKGGGLRAMAAELINALGALDVAHGVLALDDTHRITDLRIFKLLDLLLDGLPHHWTVAMATRSKPPLALARLRSQRELVEFTQADLSFSREEIQRLWAAEGQDDSSDMAQRQLTRTQGWPAGLCLLLRADGRAGASAVRRSRQHLFDYLAAEVFEQMPTELREFLMRCSVLPELTEARCITVSRNPRAWDLLADTERRSIFVSVLDADEFTLRLHDLFRDFLEDQLKRHHAEEIPELLRRAAECEDDPVRKIKLLLRAGGSDDAERVLSDMAASMLAEGGDAQIMHLIEQFPAPARAGSPHLQFALGLCAWQQSDDVALEEAMHQAAQGFDGLGHADAAQEARAFEALARALTGRLDESRQLTKQLRTSAMSQTVAVLCELCDCWHASVYGPPSGPAEHLMRMVAILSADAPPNVWYACFPHVHRFSGRVGTRRALEEFIRGARRAAHGNHAPLLHAADVLEARLLLLQGRVLELSQAIRRIEEENRWLGRPRSSRRLLLGVKLSLHMLRGDRAGADAALSELEADLPARPSAAVAFTAVIARGRASATLGDWNTVRDVLTRLDDMLSNGDPGHLSPLVQALHARMQLHEGRLDEALALLRDLARGSEDFDRNGLDASIRIHLAVAELRNKSSASAWAALRSVVEHTQSTGEMGVALLLGPAILAELALGPWDVTVPPHLLMEIRNWADSALRCRLGEVDNPEALTSEPLSSREHEVLAHIASGESNKLIARALDLSPHTVKRHVARILDRLDMSSRGEAAAWFRRHQDVH